MKKNKSTSNTFSALTEYVPGSEQSYKVALSIMNLNREQANELAADWAEDLAQSYKKDLILDICDVQITISGPIDHLTALKHKAPTFCFDADGFDSDGFDVDGFDSDGYDSIGFNRIGFNDEGFDYNGFDKDAVDKDGFDRDGLYRIQPTCPNCGAHPSDDRPTGNGFVKAGFNDKGYDVDKDGFDRNGFDKDGFNEDGYDKEGFDYNGFDSTGYNREGFDDDLDMC